MASPFPGMDPYLEHPRFWRDFHSTFIGCWREEIADLLPASYEARLDERVDLVQVPLEMKRVFPDVAVSRQGRGRRRARAATGGGGTLLLEPVSIPHQILEEVRDTWIEIYRGSDRTLVAVLELLSPTNKTGDGYHEYRSKQKALLRQKIHLVELDLLVGGGRLELEEPLPKGDYFAFLSRAENRPNCEVFSWRLRDPLPTIPIPLKAPDADLLIDLAKVFQQTYERGRYAPWLDYGKRPLAPLSKEDAKWAAALSRKI